nr:isoform 2 of oxysterol-binding protein-related protein 1c [Quercus suber]
MHPLYCVTRLPDRTSAAAATPQTFSDLLKMPPPHPNTPSLRSLSTHSFRISADHSRLIKRSNSSALERSTRQTAPSSLRDMDVVINDIVGSGISGVLYKWVNYGRGWRPRWFVLQDGLTTSQMIIP